MTSITLGDGLVLTIVSMITVFALLGALWGITSLMAKFFGEEEAPTSSAPVAKDAAQTSGGGLLANKKHQKVAEMTALIVASEGIQDRKFEIVESKRIK